MSPLSDPRGSVSKPFRGCEAGPGECQVLEERTGPEYSDHVPRAHEAQLSAIVVPGLECTSRSANKNGRR